MIKAFITAFGIVSIVSGCGFWASYAIHHDLGAVIAIIPFLLLVTIVIAGGIYTIGIYTEEKEAKK